MLRVDFYIYIHIFLFFQDGVCNVYFFFLWVMEALRCSKSCIASGKKLLQGFRFLKASCMVCYKLHFFMFWKLLFRGLRNISFLVYRLEFFFPYCYLPFALYLPEFVSHSFLECGIEKKQISQTVRQQIIREREKIKWQISKSFPSTVPRPCKHRAQACIS